MSISTFLTNTVVLGIIEAAPLILATIGFTIIYCLNGFINVGYAENLTVGGYIGVLFSTTLGFNYYLSIIPAALAGGGLSLLTYLVIFRPAFRRGVGESELIILSVGLSFFMRHLLRVFFGYRALGYQLDNQKYISLFGGVGVTDTQLICIGLAILLAVGLYVFMFKTNNGITMRALAANETLASVCGVNPLKVSALVWFIAGVAGGLAGVFLATFSYAHYLLGWNLILIFIMISIVGGIGNIKGAIIASVVTGMITTGVVLLANQTLYGDIVLLICFITILKIKKVRA